MLLTITTTHQPATELGYLLHKHPDKCQTFALSFGKAHIFYPEASIDRSTVALLLEVDPVKLVRGRGATLSQYVSDRPYVASSFFSVAISQVFGTALGARSKDRPELAQTPIPLIVNISILPCRGGEGLLRNLFEPLGYTIQAQRHPLDKEFPQWGDSPYFTVELQNTIRLSELLSHLYVLIPVLDDDKHYWVGEEEVEKLLRHGEGWLNSHPAKNEITKRYLKRQYRLTRAALAQLTEEDNPNLGNIDQQQNQQEEATEKSLSLNQLRLNTVLTTLKAENIKDVIDLGCGEGKLLKLFLQENCFDKITGVDVSYRILEIARERLETLHLPHNQWEKLKLIQGALTYQDKRFHGYDGATLIEVIEHLDLSSLTALERVVFEFAKPKLIIVTTPNIEYNVKFENLATGKLRHKDHRFEWTRQEFRDWANNVAQNFRYHLEFQSIGEEDTVVGPPTQMAIFKL